MCSVPVVPRWSSTRPQRQVTCAHTHTHGETERSQNYSSYLYLCLMIRYKRDHFFNPAIVDVRQCSASCSVRNVASARSDCSWANAENQSRALQEWLFFWRLSVCKQEVTSASITSSEIQASHRDVITGLSVWIPVPTWWKWEWHLTPN